MKAELDARHLLVEQAGEIGAYCFFMEVARLPVERDAESIRPSVPFVAGSREISG